MQGDEAEELLARKRKKVDSDEEDTPDDGMYRGQKGYQQHIKKSKEIPKAMRIGPQRASGSTIRTVTIVDYQPDVCKDYKGTPCFTFEFAISREPRHVLTLDFHHRDWLLRVR